MDDLTVARHEAGHALVAVELGVSFIAATIIPSDIGRGCVWGFRRTLAPVCLGGLIAERLFAGAWPSWDHGEVDLRVAVQNHANGSTVQRAGVILSSRMRALDAVASALIRRGTVTWAEIRKLANRYPAEDPRRTWSPLTGSALASMLVSRVSQVIVVPGATTPSAIASVIKP